MTRIYYVRDDSDLGFNRDLFVVADDYKQALSIWRMGYEMDAADEPVSIYEVPLLTDTRPRLLEWNDLDGMNRVFRSEKTHPAI